MLASIATSSAVNARNFVRDHLASFKLAKEFFTNLQADLERLGSTRRGPLVLREGQVPDYLIPYGNVLRRHSELLQVLGVNRTVRVQQNGIWRITKTGHVERVWGRRGR